MTTSSDSGPASCQRGRQDAYTVPAGATGQEPLKARCFVRFGPEITYIIFRTFDLSFMLGGWYKQEERDLWSEHDGANRGSRSWIS